MSDLDPATEILPVVSPAPLGVDEVGDARRTSRPGARTYDGQQTIVMPAVQPSGSAARPSGAVVPITSAAATSPNVVEGEDEPSGRTGPEHDDEPVGQAPSLRKDGNPDRAQVDTADPGDATPPDDGPVPQIDSAAAPAAAAEGAAEVAAPVPPAAGGGATGTPPADLDATVMVEARQARSAEPTIITPAAAAQDVDLFSSPSNREPADSGPADSGPAESGPADSGPAESVPAESVPAESVPAGSGAVEDPPEEPRDPVAADLVGTLEDEVVVIDEQPRYHLGECRALVAVVVIPLPVREAVELGFTPCGWCSPDRTLAGRHQTASR
jgi:hypothetical protein